MEKCKEEKGAEEKQVQGGGHIQRNDSKESIWKHFANSLMRQKMSVDLKKQDRYGHNCILTSDCLDDGFAEKMYCLK